MKSPASDEIAAYPVRPGFALAVGLGQSNWPSEPPFARLSADIGSSAVSRCRGALLAQASDARVQRWMRLEHARDALVREGVHRIERLGRRRGGELDQLGRPIEPQQRVCEVVAAAGRACSPARRPGARVSARGECGRKRRRSARGCRARPASASRRPGWSRGAWLRRGRRRSARERLAGGHGRARARSRPRAPLAVAPARRRSTLRATSWSVPGRRQRAVESRPRSGRASAAGLRAWRRRCRPWSARRGPRPGRRAAHRAFRAARDRRIDRRSSPRGARRTRRRARWSCRR